MINWCSACFAIDPKIMKKTQKQRNSRRLVLLKVSSHPLVTVYLGKTQTQSSNSNACDHGLQTTGDFVNVQKVK